MEVHTRTSTEAGAELICTVYGLDGTSAQTWRQPNGLPSTLPSLHKTSAPVQGNPYVTQNQE
eukprot:13037526-Alexandrium_andersonii.AAC.1